MLCPGLQGMTEAGLDYGGLVLEFIEQAGSCIPLPASWGHLACMSLHCLGPTAAHHLL